MDGSYITCVEGMNLLYLYSFTWSVLCRSNLINNRINRVLCLWQISRVSRARLGYSGADAAISALLRTSSRALISPVAFLFFRSASSSQAAVPDQTCGIFAEYRLDSDECCRQPHRGKSRRRLQIPSSWLVSKSGAKRAQHQTWMLCLVKRSKLEINVEASR